MTRLLKKSVAVIALAFWAVVAFAAPDAAVCPELSGYLAKNQTTKLPDPSREPTQAERSVIDRAKLELLERTDYAMGLAMVDADNDGKDDVFAWNIQGSGRYVYAELLEMSARPAGTGAELVPKTSMGLGVLDDPRFVRFKGVNYLVSTNTGDSDGMVITRISRTAAGQYQQHTVCRMQTTVKADKACRHPACNELRRVIESGTENQPFINVEWPHKYFAPAGLEVYFSGDWSAGDFDNTGKPTSLWRIGRQGYVNQHIYWTLLGQGDVPPNVEPGLRPKSEDKTTRRVLPGVQHDRLRRTLAQQGQALGHQLHRPVTLPDMGEFFLFKANGNRTYWAWDFGEPPYGEEIHITYTNAQKSDYVGLIGLTRDQALAPCTSKCVVSLDR